MEQELQDRLKPFSRFLSSEDYAKLLKGLKKELELNPKESEAFNGQYNNQPGGRQTDILGL